MRLVRANSPKQRYLAVRLRYYWSCVATVGDGELYSFRQENAVIIPYQQAKKDITL